MYSKKYLITLLDNFINNMIDNNESNEVKEMVIFKRNHILRVAKNCEMIAKSLKLSDEQIYISYLIGILHDIGRFEQAKKSGNIGDVDVIEHANLGAKYLQEGLINDFLTKDLHTDYKDIIIKSVKQHNKFDIDVNYDSDTKLFCKIIRDADKLDIFKFLNDYTPEFYNYDFTNDYEYTDEVLKEFIEFKTISFELMKTKLDRTIIQLAMIFDINFDYTIKVIKNKKYLENYINQIKMNSNIKKVFDDIKFTIDNYIKSKI